MTTATPGDSPEIDPAVDDDVNDPATAAPASGDGGAAPSADGVDAAMTPDDASTEPSGDGEPVAGAPLLAEQLEQSQQRVLRLQAELENYRKRSQRLMDQQQRYAAMPLLRDLLAVVDNLERALEAARQNQQAGGLLEGVTMVFQQLLDVLQRHDCRPVEADGKRFDPTYHEAIAQTPSDQVPPGTILQVTQTGYTLHDRVVRPSQVIVSTNAPNTELAGEPAQAASEQDDDSSTPSAE